MLFPCCATTMEAATRTVWLLLGFLRCCFRSRAGLVMENLMLRQQLHCYKLTAGRPSLKPFDRSFWVMMKRWIPAWRNSLLVVQPATVCRWHRAGFRLFWRWKSLHGKPGRPKIDEKLRELIRQMSIENVTWGTPRIRDELKMLGHRVALCGIRLVRTSYQSPWQNGYCERVIGSIRRECLNQMIVLGQRHLMRRLRDYACYYNQHRVHQSLGGDTPLGREPEPPDRGEVVAIAYLGGLHHRYTRRAA